MNVLQNLHTHTTYCDGKNTNEEMILAAIERGFGAIGISGHSYMHFSPYLSKTQDDTADYKKEIRALAARYKDRIDVFCGIEYEYYSDVDQSGFDYTIASVHYLHIGNEYVGFDRSASEVRRVIDTYFGGDGMRYARAYYELLATLPSRGNFDIIGHIDLICKHAETHPEYFDVDCKQYKAYVLDALDALKGKIPLFEVNTGAIARGYRKTPYPMPFILRELRARGFGAIISSDCHDARYLDCHFKESEKLLAECGFKEKYILTKSGFVAVPLEAAL